MTLESQRASITYVLKHLGMETVGDELRRARDTDHVEARLRLPWLVEPVQFAPGETEPAVIVDKIAAAQSRLFAKVLAYMAEHDEDIRAIIERQKRLAAKRDELIAVLEGMASQ